MSIIAMCFLLSTMFSKAKTASLLGPIIFFASYFPYYAVNDPQYDSGAKTATCILAPACFALGANVFADFEGGLVGVQRSNVGQETSNFSYNACIAMLLFDAVLYGLLAWYLDKVLPSEYGTSMPLYFPLLPSYWCGIANKTYSERDSTASKKSNLVGDYFSSVFSANTNISYEAVSPERLLRGDVNGAHCSSVEEDVSADLRQQIGDYKCVQVRGMTRKFKNAAGGEDRVAVNDLNLNLYQNQISVLLGSYDYCTSTDCFLAY